MTPTVPSAMVMSARISAVATASALFIFRDARATETRAMTSAHARQVSVIFTVETGRLNGANLNSTERIERALRAISEIVARKMINSMIFVFLRDFVFTISVRIIPEKKMTPAERNSQNRVNVVSLRTPTVNSGSEPKLNSDQTTSTAIAQSMQPTKLRFVGNLFPFLERMIYEAAKNTRMPMRISP